MLGGYGVGGACEEGGKNSCKNAECGHLRTFAPPFPWSIHVCVVFGTRVGAAHEQRGTGQRCAPWWRGEEEGAREPDRKWDLNMNWSPAPQDRAGRAMRHIVISDALSAHRTRKTRCRSQRPVQEGQAAQRTGIDGLPWSQERHCSSTQVRAAGFGYVGGVAGEEPGLDGRPESKQAYFVDCRLSF